MKNRLFSLKMVGGMLLLGVLLTACNPKKKVQKYAYLLKDKPASTTAPKDNPNTVPVPEDNVADTRAAFAEDIRKVVKEAEGYLGTPYKYGGANKSGTDCSGLTQNAWARAGVSLPRSSRGQSEYGTKVTKKQIHPGDLVFFSAYKNGKIDHVGLVTDVSGEEITFIHATVSKGVMHNRLDTGYWSERFMQARRVK